MCALLFVRNVARADASAVTPPTLTHFVGATDPRDALPRERASVELLLDIDREGAVTAVTVTRSAGDVLDRAAVAAANAFVFAPATRDDRPIAARVRYDYVFAAVSPELLATGSVGGTVLAHDGDVPIAGARIVVTTDGGATLLATSGARGDFRVDGVPAGPIHVVVTMNGRVPSRTDETLEPNTLVEVKLRLDGVPDPEAFAATARVDAPPREVTRRTLGREEMTRIAGTRGDPLRAIELLPGVSRPAGGGGLPILRGANADDSQVFVEGATVPALYHLGGLTSIVHSRVLESVDLFPSNFSVRYGRKTGGVVEVGRLAV